MGSGWSGKPDGRSSAEGAVANSDSANRTMEDPTVQIANDFWMLRSSIDDPPVLDEEVRLFYVAISLAKHLLDASSELIQM